MKFMNEEHKAFYETRLAQCRYQDAYHKALVYTLGLTNDCRANFDLLYDVKTGFVNPDIFRDENSGWITGTDRRIIYLAYHLYNDGCPTAHAMESGKEKEEEIGNYLISNLFDYPSEQFAYMLEAIRIRFERVG